MENRISVGMLWDHTRCDRTHLGGGWRNNLGGRMFLVFGVTITPGVIGHIWGGGGRNNLGERMFLVFGVTITPGVILHHPVGWTYSALSPPMTQTSCLNAGQYVRNLYKPSDRCQFGGAASTSLPGRTPALGFEDASAFRWKTGSSSRI